MTEMLTDALLSMRKECDRETDPLCLRKYLMENGRLNGDTIVTTVMSNLGLYKACDKIGMKYEKTAVGDKYVYENMCKNNFSLGGEQSGTYYFQQTCNNR